MNLAPVILFVYSRLNHTKETIQALQKNELAKESELFIYSDAAKNENANEGVNKVREYIRTVDGFKNITIIEREKNWGLADSIIDGVTKIVNEYGKVIVLEDDLVTSPYFLRFMNDALVFYEDKKEVWHISGWNYPIKTDGIDDIFLWRVMNCWGWATWMDRWRYFEKDTQKAITLFSIDDIKRFNLDNAYNFWKQVVDNKNGKINTWAIFWYVTIFKNSGLCLNPVQTYVKNIGLDGSGTNCGIDNSFEKLRSTKKKVKFESKIVENDLAVKRVKDYYKKKKSLHLRFINKIIRIFIKRNLFK